MIWDQFVSDIDRLREEEPWLAEKLTEIALSRSIPKVDGFVYPELKPYEIDIIAIEVPGQTIGHTAALARCDFV